MKKIVSCFICLCAGVILLQAQKKIQPARQKLDTSKQRLVLVNQAQSINGNIALAPEIKIFEKPNFQGASASLVRKPDGSFYLPFPLSNVSFKVPDGKIVYIKRCFEFGSETAYFTSQTNISLQDICGIRTDEKASIEITFTGISTEVHNQDCMRFSGTVLIKILETAPDNASSDAVMQYTQMMKGRQRYLTRQGECRIFDWSTSTQRTSRQYSPLYNNTNTIFNNNPVPELTKIARDYFDHTDSSYKVVFTVGKTALREGRLSVWTKTDLVSAHKTCDLCDDFSSGIKMETPGFASFPINKTGRDGKRLDAANPYFIAGPFRAKGSRDGFAVTASAGTIKNFRVHFAAKL